MAAHNEFKKSNGGARREQKQWRGVFHTVLGLEMAAHPTHIRCTPDAYPNTTKMAHFQGRYLHNHWPERPFANGYT
jgi:hypothetical protein